MVDIADRRTNIASIQDEVRANSMSPNRGIPRGSDAFQKTLNEVYGDMQKEREKRRAKHQQNGSIDEEDEFSDEERDKCTDFNRFRRFSQDFSAKQHHFARLHHMQSPRNQHPVRRSLESLDDFKEPNVNSSRMQRRRHSIATLPMTNLKTNSKINER